MYTVGEKPGAGDYICSVCGTVEHLDKDTDTLAPCAKCHGTEFHK